MAVDTLAVRVCRAFRTAPKNNEAWVSLDRLVGQTGSSAARRSMQPQLFASEKGCLASGDEAANFALLLDRAP